MTDSGAAAPSGIQVIARAAEILRALQASPGGVTQAEIAGQLGLARTTAHRILRALEEEGLVTTSGRRGHYRIGPAISQLAETAQRDLRDRLRPYLQDVVRATGESADLSVLDDATMRFLHQEAAPHRLQAVTPVGSSFPAHSCAPGKAALAALPADRREAALPVRLVALTHATLTVRSELEAQLRAVNATGLAYDLEEHTAGICAVAAVIDKHNPVPLAISIPVPAQRFYGREGELGEALTGLVARIRGDLGLRP